MSIVGEAFLTASIELLFKKLASTDLLQFASQEPIHGDLNKWKKILVKIQAVLQDAEESQVRNQSVKLWLGELQNLAFDVEDILDEFATEALRKKLLHESDQASTSKVRKLIPSCFRGLNPRTLKFNSSIVSQMEKITTRLHEIAAQKDQLGLKEYSGGKSSKKVKQRLPTTSLVNENKVYGRGKDQEAIVGLLLKDDLSTEDGVSIIPIIGMGGMGKTTLAQLAYNDVRLEGRFDLKAWVCVSEEFDVIRITKTILHSINAAVNVGHGNDLNKLQEDLKKELYKKKFLLVLDDIWNENPNGWNLLRRPFEAGSPESKIIVTTRNEGVSTLMGTLPAYPLKELSNDACLCVFAQNSLGRTDFSMRQHLKEIAEKIVKKCNGLPLAAETLGGLLRGKLNHKDWEEVLNSEVWNLPEERSNIIPALRVSYYYLPSHLKRCFAYCSIFPKDYEFPKEEIILLWMAEGLLQHRNNKKQMEDLGCEVFQDLKSRSFFQQSSKDISRFVMHDLINDLAQWAAGEICLRIDNKLDNSLQMEVSKNLRYLSYIRGSFDGIKKFEALCNTKLLRTFLPLELSDAYDVQGSWLTGYILHMLPKLRYLRTLSLRQYKIFELPNTIGELKHLRYLDISHTEIETLPEPIGNLYNLETLFLEGCSRLKKLCADMGNLINLHHLNNSEAHALEEMPLRIGNSTGLLTLPNFVVGKSRGSKLGELKSLKRIRQRICISGLENANALDAKKADLNGKRNLDVIVLEWTSSSDDSREAGNETQVLDMLRPHQGLKGLTISGYGGTMFPVWLGESSFSILVILTLENCSKCINLPSVGQLPLLKYLFIRKMDGVKSVGPEFYACSKPFPSLKTLCFEDMEEWEEWIPHRPHQEDEEFSLLQELSIIRCSKLVGRLPEHLPSLERLTIRSCEQLLVSIPSLPSLCRLDIGGCKQVVQRSTVDLVSLKSVFLSGISSYVCPTEWFTQGLIKVEELNIFGCRELKSFWQNRIELLQNDSNLRHLVIKDCPQLLCLVAEEKKEEEQQQLDLPCSLEYLVLNKCESFVKLPQALRSFSFLTEIYIRKCPKLVSFPETGMPAQLRILTIRKCNALKSFPDAWMCSNNTYLKSLYIEECRSLTYIAKVQLPLNLKRLVIRKCNLWTLVDEEEVSTMQMEMTDGGDSRNTSLLEYLHIEDCASLTLLWTKSELPATLEHISLSSCINLASLLSRGKLPKALKYLLLFNCPKIKLPEDLHSHSYLQHLRIYGCTSLVSFPEEGLPSLNLTQLEIHDCEKLEALPNRMHNLTSLKCLTIKSCPSLVSFPVYGFPTSLTHLLIEGVNICQPFFNWGLHKLTSLKNLMIAGVGQDVVSFPREEIGIMLPTSLTYLKIENFPNLECIASEIQNLTSLESLNLSSCYKLKSFPEDGLPSSLLELYISECPIIEQMCEKDKGHYWSMIKHIPYIAMNYSIISVDGPSRSFLSVYIHKLKRKYRGPFQIHL